MCLCLLLLVFYFGDTHKKTPHVGCCNFFLLGQTHITGTLKTCQAVMSIFFYQVAVSSLSKERYKQLFARGTKRFSSILSSKGRGICQTPSKGEGQMCVLRRDRVRRLTSYIYLDGSLLRKAFWFSVHGLGVHFNISAASVKAQPQAQRPTLVRMHLFVARPILLNVAWSTLLSSNNQSFSLSPFQ